MDINVFIHGTVENSPKICCLFTPCTLRKAKCKPEHIIHNNKESKTPYCSRKPKDLGLLSSKDWAEQTRKQLRGQLPSSRNLGRERLTGKKMTKAGNCSQKKCKLILSDGARQRSEVLKTSSFGKDVKTSHPALRPAECNCLYYCFNHVGRTLSPSFYDFHN